MCIADDGRCDTKYSKNMTLWFILSDARKRAWRFLYYFFFTNSYVYKLSDFGTAKPLKDGDFFQSLVGTEEYLVNKIYILMIEFLIFFILKKNAIFTWNPFSYTLYNYGNHKNNNMLWLEPSPKTVYNIQVLVHQCMPSVVFPYKYYNSSNIDRLINKSFSTQISSRRLSLTATDRGSLTYLWTCGVWEPHSITPPLGRFHFSRFTGAGTNIPCKL